MPLDVISISHCQPFTTKDGSTIRELLSHRNSSIRNQSLAEARVPSGITTELHHHPKTEEIYYILEGFGVMEIDGIVRDVAPGDAIAIPPNTKHRITARGPEELRFLCCCAPGYEHSDTVLDSSGRP